MDSIAIDIENGQRVVSIYLSGVAGMEEDLADLVDYYGKLQDTQIDLIFNQIYGSIN